MAETPQELARLRASRRPFVLRGALERWPLVRARVREDPDQETKRVSAKIISTDRHASIDCCCEPRLGCLILADVPCAVFIFGPPAVGKMTVGQALARRTGFALLHNHVVSDMVAPFFATTTPQFASLTKSITQLLVTDLRAAYPGLIFTRTHCFDDALDAEMMQALLELVGAARRCFVELSAPLEVRLERNQTENRLLHKPSKRDLVASEARVRRNDARTFSPPDGQLPWSGERLRLDNSQLDPDEVAARICDHFSLLAQPAEVVRS